MHKNDTVLSSFNPIRGVLLWELFAQKTDILACFQNAILPHLMTRGIRPRVLNLESLGS